MRNRTLPVLAVVSLALISCQVARLVPDAEAELTVSAAAREKGDFRAALEHAQKAVVLAPRMTQAHFTVGEIADVLCIPNAQPGPDDRTCGLAIQEYKTTLKLDPSHGEALKNLAFLLYQFGKMDESESYYRKALALHPDDPELLGAVAAIDYRRIAPDVMTMMAQQKTSLIQSPACTEVRDSNRARFEEGIALLTRAVQIRSSNSELKAYLSVLYLLRADIECGNRSAYQADMKTARAWDQARKETSKNFQQDILPKLPSAPPPLPDSQQ